MAAFPPLTHVALTVRDLSASVPWYEALFDAEPVIDEDTDPGFHHTVYLIANGTLIGLHQHDRPAPEERFSEFRVGLDHVAFGCANRGELEKWVLRLDGLGVEHGGIKDATLRLGRELPGSRWHRARALCPARLSHEPPGCRIGGRPGKGGPPPLRSFSHDRRAASQRARRSRNVWSIRSATTGNS